MCVESHENVHNDEQSSTTTTTATTVNNSIDGMEERIDNSTRNGTNTYQIDSDMVTSTSFLMETYEPTAPPTPPTTTTTTMKANQHERDESECRANGATV